jgi:hypothetical protein
MAPGMARKKALQMASEYQLWVFLGPDPHLVLAEVRHEWRMAHTHMLYMHFACHAAM